MIFRTFSSLALVTCLVTQPVFSSQAAGGKSALRGEAPRRLEFPGGEYIQVPRSEMRTSPAYRDSTQDFFITQVNVDSAGENILGDAANEPSIAVDPTDPDKIAIGWRQFNTVLSSFRQAGWGYTADAGHTWTFPGVIEPGVFRSDPVLDSDSDGNFYYNSLTVSGEAFWCNVFRSTDGGMTWDSGAFAQGGDKQWMVIDKTGGIGDGNIYADWTMDWSICYPGFFTRSTNGGDSFENCITIPDDPFWGTLAVGPGGELYVGGANYYGFSVAKSSNAQYSGQDVSWDFSTPVNLDGYIGYGGGPNPDGLLGETWIAVDRSTGPTSGNVYLLCSVVRFSTPDPADVMFARSTDGGQTWSPPVRVNDDPGNDAYQWFGTMSVAPNGRIDVIWLDTRNDPGGYDSELYYSYSSDAGDTWSPNERLSDSFDPHVGWPQQDKMGDYFDMVSDNIGFNLAWAATFNGEQDVYYGRYHGHIPAIIYVPDDFTTIQAAIDTAVSGYQEVVVRPGTYHEHDIDFLGKAITVRGTDPEDSSVVAATVVDGDSLGSAFVFQSGEDSTSVLTGFTITGGRALNGGGIFCESSPIITRNIITRNMAIESGGGIAGGGKFHSPIVSDNIITGNSAASGGGVMCPSPISMVISGNTITDNTATIQGGGIICYYSIPIMSNLISRNSARTGGGIYCISSSPMITNNLITSNESTTSGGGIYCITASPTLINNIVFDNGSGSQGGGLHCEGSSMEAINTIFWENTSETGSEIYLEGDLFSQPSVLTIRYSDVEGGQTSVYVDSVSTLDWGGGMLDVDPLFRDPAGGDYHLSAVACGDSVDSPCIDSGDPTLIDSLLACSWGLGTDASDIGAFGGGDSVQVGIGNEGSGGGGSIPRAFGLSQNHPNPFNPSTTIGFDVPESSGRQRSVSLTVYDLRGRRVRTLVEGSLDPGHHVVRWDGRSDRGEAVSSGIYLYTLRSGVKSFTRKMILLK